MPGWLVKLLRSSKLYIVLGLVAAAVLFVYSQTSGDSFDRWCNNNVHGFCDQDGQQVSTARRSLEGGSLVVVLNVAAIKNTESKYESQLKSLIGNLTLGSIAHKRSVLLEFWVDRTTTSHDATLSPELLDLCTTQLHRNCFIVSSSDHARFVREVVHGVVAFVALSVNAPKQYIMAETNAPVVVTSIDMMENLHWLGSLSTLVWRHWNTPKVTVVVITQTRAPSLKRLLKTLTDTEYLGDDVALSFVVDQSPQNRDVLKVCSTTKWPYGRVSMRHRINQAGLISAIVESWYPSNDDEYGTILEDDISVSPLWYMYVKNSILQFRYGVQSNEFRKLLSGLSLYTPRLSEARLPREKLNFTATIETSQFLFQWPCSWGAVFFPEHWREFHVFIATRMQPPPTTPPTPPPPPKAPKPPKPFNIPSAATNNWQGSWKKFFIEMMYGRGYVMVYPNFANQTSFSTNHLEFGVHTKNPNGSKLAHGAEDYTVPLFDWVPYDRNHRSVYPPVFEMNLATMPVLDVFAKRSDLRELVAKGKAWNWELVTCPSGQARVLDTYGYITCNPIKKPK